MKNEIDIARIRDLAEGYYRDGDFYCSEAIVKTIKDEFHLPISDDVIAAASGFPIGIGGSGCSCGAVTGGVMALGLFFGRTEAKDDKVNKAMVLANELHEIFRKSHNAICCRILTAGMELGSPKHMEKCISLTGEVAEEVAKIILREMTQLKVE